MIFRLCSSSRHSDWREKKMVWVFSWCSVNYLRLFILALNLVTQLVLFWILFTVSSWVHVVPQLRNGRWQIPHYSHAAALRVDFIEHRFQECHQCSCTQDFLPNISGKYFDSEPGTPVRHMISAYKKKSTTWTIFMFVILVLTWL